MQEVHEYDQGLLVIDGILELSLSGESVSVRAGELFVVKAGTAHTVSLAVQGHWLLFCPVEIIAVHEGENFNDFLLSNSPLTEQG